MFLRNVEKTEVQKFDGHPAEIPFLLLVAWIRAEPRADAPVINCLQL